MNICFVANFYKTFLFHELAKKFLPHNISVFWVVTKLDQYNFLKEHYPPQNILHINRSCIDKKHAPIDDFRINELVYGDRVFKHEIENGVKFLTNIQFPLYNFLKSNQIRFIFGEITWGHELLLLRMATKRTELNCLFIQCSVVRIPNGRFAFFSSEGEADIVEFDEPYNEEAIITIEKPRYLKLNDAIVKKNKSLIGRLKRVKRFITGENIESNDPNVIVNGLTRFKIASTEELNKSLYNLLPTYDYEQLKSEKFVFYGFHKQPESSIDVFGRYYEDQSQVVINLWRLLPHDWKLVIKEHTNAIGDRSHSFYKKLLTYPGVLLADEKIDSKLLIEKSKLVATVSGTIAYEAALMKKPSITFARIFFNALNYCKFMTIDELVKYDSLATLTSELESKTDNRKEFSNYLMKNSFKGMVSDFMSDPAVMDEDNLESLSIGFLKLISKHNKSQYQ